MIDLLPKRVDASYKDDSGYVFKAGDMYYRRVFKDRSEDFVKFYGSPLYYQLLSEKAIIPLEESKESFGFGDDSLVYKPRQLFFNSYPQEWAFSQLKDAALLTLDIMKMSLHHGFVLKDATPHNIKFEGCNPVHIDTASFVEYHEGEPWIAYRQFCESFLAPLALMAYRDVRLSNMFVLYPDGIPLDLCSRLLPLNAGFNAGVLFNVFIQSLIITRAKNNSTVNSVRLGKFNKKKLLNLIEQLRLCVGSITPGLKRHQWSGYYEFHNYSNEDFDQKKYIVSNFFKCTHVGSLWDVGSNNGFFSRLAPSSVMVVSTDIDLPAVSENYEICKAQSLDNIIPLFLNVVNPTPGVGWANEENSSFLSRINVDCIMALAVVHHLYFTHHIKFGMMAKLFADRSKWLLIEFVPLEDPQVTKIKGVDRAAFGGYTVSAFEAEFLRFFKIHSVNPLGKSGRTLYIFKTEDAL